MFVFKMNPMYHFLRFARSTIIDGISPEPKAYLFCLIAAFLPLVIGAAVFKKSQSKFILSL
jgi:ABC-2 type transport system permease protein